MISIQGLSTRQLMGSTEQEVERSQYHQIGMSDNVKDRLPYLLKRGDVVVDLERHNVFNSYVGMHINTCA